MKPTRRHYLVIVQILISGALLAWLIRLANPADLLAAATRVSPLALVVTGGLLAIAASLVAIRQWVVLRMLGIDISLGRMAVLTWLGFFANNFLPSSVGGDAAIAIALHRRYRRLDAIVTGLLLNRVIGLFALLLVLLILLMLVDLGQLQDLIDRLTWWCLALLVAIILGGIGLLLILRSGSRLSRLLSALISRLRAIGQTAVSISRATLIALVLSIAIMLLIAIAPAMLGQWQYPPAGFWATATIILMLQLVQLIPITFNGIGMAESVTTYCLTHIGWPLQEAVLFSLMLRGLTIAVSLPGVLAFMLPGNKAVLPADAASKKCIGLSEK
jgi:uncharacterized membrane protein YbhN (UPF0104 family)